MPNDASPTREQVAVLMAQTFALVQACPVGRATTYGWLAKALGYPRGARMVGWFINEASAGVPAQRVVNSKGELTGSWAFGSPDRMRDLLASEGITFSDDGRVDLKRYGWDPSRDLTEAERADVLSGASQNSVTVSDRLLYLLRNDPASPLRGASSGV